jgi:hypothetical protein
MVSCRASFAHTSPHTLIYTFSSRKKQRSQKEKLVRLLDPSSGPRELTQMSTFSPQPTSMPRLMTPLWYVVLFFLCIFYVIITFFSLSQHITDLSGKETIIRVTGKYLFSLSQTQHVLLYTTPHSSAHYRF